MPRERKKKTPAENSETITEPTEVAAGTMTESSVASEPNDAAITASSQTDESAAEPGRPKFRSWVVDAERGYTRMTDEANRRLVLQFAAKPDADVLASIKGGGFQFRPDYYGLRNVWVRQNDFEGRLQVEGIEKLLREVTTEQELPPF